MTNDLCISLAISTTRTAFEQSNLYVEHREHIETRSTASAGPKEILCAWNNGRTCRHAARNCRP